MLEKDISIDNSWHTLLSDEFEKNYFLSLKENIKREYENKTIYPQVNLIFNAFNLTQVERVKAVIIGQDPYHGENQAHGLSFSVPDDILPPPSLINIFKELETDVGREKTDSGNLTSWAKQGVLLMNSTLTVIADQPNSHKHLDWSLFTDKVIELLSSQRENIVFLLWGRYAQKKESLINMNNNHLVLKSVHPSPLSAYRGFFGCKHFSQTNKYLNEKGKIPINW